MQLEELVHDVIWNGCVDEHDGDLLDKTVRIAEKRHPPPDDSLQGRDDRPLLRRILKKGPMKRGDCVKRTDIGPARFEKAIDRLLADGEVIAVAYQPDAPNWHGRYATRYTLTPLGLSRWRPYQRVGGAR